MCIWKKSRGEDFYRRQVIDFPEWVSIKPCHCWLWNSRSPSAFVLFFLFNVSQFYNLGFVSLSQSRRGKYSLFFFVMDIGQHQLWTLHIFVQYSNFDFFWQVNLTSSALVSSFPWLSPNHGASNKVFLGLWCKHSFPRIPMMQDRSTFVIIYIISFLHPNLKPKISFSGTTMFYFVHYSDSPPNPSPISLIVVPWWRC